MFRKILIANRGEIAVRIVRACREMGISPVVVFSKEDRDSLHVKLSDEAYEIGPGPSSQSYLLIERVLEAARRSKSQAIHPGYGFLSENAEFAQATQDAGLVFIGPSATAMRLMGDKIASREAMRKAGVPVVPGTDSPVDSLEDARAAARRIGFPVVLKASAGGGGKGMRVISEEREIDSLYQQARSEADSSFGDDRVYLEKFLRRPRHVEVQILGDHHGRRLHLGERECSIQRRHQKIVEECPSPCVDPDLRSRLGETALQAAEAVNYYNAGTVEMLIESDDRGGEPHFYFLEMNTRLQVEHPVTEMVTGIDLVREQIGIAAGEPLSRRQQDIRWNGWAIECRVYAEDPFNDFLPCPGRILTLLEPAGPGVRNDSGVFEGFEVPVYYDPLISKLITHGETRLMAIERMKRALSEYRIAGIRTNLPFFHAVFSHPEFLAGHLSTDFIDRHGLLDDLTGSDGDELAAVAAALDYHSSSRRRKSPISDNDRPSLWKTAGRTWKRPGFEK